MEKGSKKSIVIGISVLLLVTLTLLGLTYAYYRLRIIPNEKETSISGYTNKLEIEYSDNNSVITATDAEPGKSYEKTFSITNNGYENITYTVYLENVLNTFTRIEDWEYDLTCSPNCGGATNKSYPQLGGQIVENIIAPGTTQTYTFTLSYANLESVDQSDDMGKSLSGKFQIYLLEDVVDIEGAVANAETGDYVQINSEKKTSMIVDGKYRLPAVESGSHTLKIMNKNNEVKASTSLTINKGTSAVSGNAITISDDAETAIVNITNIDTTNKKLTINITDIQDYYNPYKEGTLAYRLLETAINNLNGTEYSATPKTKIAVASPNADERTLSKSFDDLGTSYYYRGKVEDNYVNFAGMCWRIVRIEGDDSIKLILEDQFTTCDDTETSETSAIYTGNWQISSGNYGYDELTVGDTKVYKRNYLNPTSAASKSMITAFNNFYNNKLTNYNNKLKTGNWCIGDKAYKEKNDNINNLIPLTNDEINSYYNLSNESNQFYYDSLVRLYPTNKDDSFPILKCMGTTIHENKVGTLTADEVVFAGAVPQSSRNNYYLINGHDAHFFTLSPAQYVDGVEFVYALHSNGNLNGVSSVVYVNKTQAFRPVISLINEEITIKDGTGLQNDPYVVE